MGCVQRFGRHSLKVNRSSTTIHKYGIRVRVKKSSEKELQQKLGKGKPDRSLPPLETLPKDAVNAIGQKVTFPIDILAMSISQAYSDTKSA